MRSRRAAIERLWIALSVVYGVFRTAIVWHYLRRYGVNPYFFAAVEFSTAAFYGLSSARMVGAVIDRNRRRLVVWIPVVVVSFFAPDVFVFLSAGKMPTSLVEVLLTVVVITTALGTISLVAQLRKTRSVVG